MLKGFTRTLYFFGIGIVFSISTTGNSAEKADLEVGSAQIKAINQLKEEHNSDSDPGFLVTISNSSISSGPESDSESEKPTKTAQFNPPAPQNSNETSDEEDYAEEESSHATIPIRTPVTTDVTRDTTQQSSWWTRNITPCFTSCFTKKNAVRAAAVALCIAVEAGSITLICDAATNRKLNFKNAYCQKIVAGRVETDNQCITARTEFVFGLLGALGALSGGGYAVISFR